MHITGYEPDVLRKDRHQYGVDPDPMVAATYAISSAELALSIGIGTTQLGLRYSSAKTA